MATRPSESTEIAVIGAGVMGTSAAYHLALRGARVLLLDKLGAAGGPSGASAGMLRAHYEDPAIVAVARYGCEFLADMLARTGSDPGFVNCGYLAVGEADREPRIRRAIEVMRSQGVVVEQLDNAQIRSLEPRLAAGSAHDRRVRAHATACASRCSWQTASPGPPRASAPGSRSGRA